MKSLIRYSIRANRDLDPTPWNTACFEKQRNVVFDTVRRGAILGTRRGGKTVAMRTRLINAIVKNPRLVAAYVTLTQQTSLQNMWQALSEANTKYGLGLIPRISEGKFYTRQGGYIWLAGCKDIREAEKFRGLAYSEFIIDEGGTHRDSVLTYLIKDSISAALTDAGAPLWISGTPGPVPQGFYWAVTTGKHEKIKPWKTHGWSVLENPHHRFYNNPEAVRQFREEEMMVDEDDPSWIREFEGRWCLDNSVLVYYADPETNFFSGVLPVNKNLQLRSTLGIDLGYDDETAFVVCSSYIGLPDVYVRHAYGESAMSNEDIALKVKELKKEFGITECYVDSGGLGKSIMHTLNRDFNLGLKPAEKTDKVAVIRRVRQALIGNRLWIAPEAAPLVDEWNVLLWNEEKTGHKDGMPDHNSDAHLYAYRSHMHLDEHREDDSTPVERAEAELDAWALTG